jgi:mono/diheme cytochrome c family protein
MRAADVICAAAAVMGAASAAAAQPQHDGTTGRTLALQLCAGCHFVAPGQRVPMSVGAPPFQEIARRPETTEFALRNIMRAPHPIMPTLILSQEEADSIISYIVGLKRSSL